jgi:site-specific recombinase XerD
MPEPFAKQAPGYFEYLRQERGLSKLTSRGYGVQLRIFQDYVKKAGIRRLRDLSPVVLSSFIVDRSHKLGKKSLKVACAAIRSFLRYAHAQGLVLRDLASAVESPRTYRFAELPRSIPWDDVQRVLAAVDRRTAVGRRDYAILLLLVTYGLRAREVAALRLQDINWHCNHLQLVGRKAGHSTAYPLSREVGEAILDYLRQGRPPTSERHVFLAAVAPRGPMTFHSVAERATHYLRKAGVSIVRPGSHTMRHTCVQRLVDSNFSLKAIGDYVGHGAPESTQVYAKVDLQQLREVGCSDVEAIL